MNEFNTIVRRGRHHGSHGDLAAESYLLRQATELWRGKPLSDVPSDSLQLTEASRLSELLLQTVERRIDLDLRLARDHETIAELRTLTAENPLREPFWYQLMAALYRTGRQGEALEAYQSISLLMDEELGISPGHQLSALHDTILNGRDLVLPNQPTVVATLKAPPTVRSPQQLPPVDTRFIGRAAELDALVAALDEGVQLASPTVVALHGPGGIGKSALAIRAGHAVASQYPDGQIYIDLQGASPGLEQVSVGDALSRILRAICGYDVTLPAAEGELAAMLRTETTDRRILILLDNAATDDQLATLLPAGSGCAVVITSRQPITTFSCTAFRATPLSAPEAIDLLSAILGADRVAGEQGSALDLVQYCGHNPLSLRVVAARLAASPELTIRHTAQRLKAGHWRDLGIEDDSVRSSLEISYLDLVERARQPSTGEHHAAEGFRMIGLLQTPEVTAPLLGALLDITVPASVATLGQLAELHLIEAAAAPGRFRMHDLLRLYSRDLAREHDSNEDCELALKRAFEWYATAVAEVSRSLDGNRFERLSATTDSILDLSTRLDATAWLDHELPNLSALAQQLPDSFREPLCRLIPMIVRQFQKRGRWREIEALIRLALPAAIQLGDQRTEATLLAGLSSCNWRANRFAEAEENLRQSATIRQSIGDPALAGLALHNLAWFYQRTGRLTEAIPYYTQSLELIDHQAEPAWFGSLLHNMGEALSEAGEYSRAQDCLERSLTVRRQCNDANGSGITLVALGRLHAHQGNYQLALTTLEAGLEVCRDLGNREDEWVALLIRSEVLRRTGQLLAAQAAVAQALAISRTVANAHGEAAGHRQLARVLTDLGQTPAAHQAQARSADLFAHLTTPIDTTLEAFLTSH
ncbi:BTAD domain-containing putative transcriptional regulator [Kribbella antibiotica]|uniref:BTAD domain-containing putative transcriptional regulator n=1 Tax=Kribbella antibiotica TaxID=190195 RepID=UPI001EDF7718|nr:BTAD domain-containing putative transcriptional regulator [Kribbella antibiotica]